MSSPSPVFDEIAWRDIELRREVRRCATGLSKLAKTIQLTEDFITPTPRKLAALISEAAGLIAEAVEKRVPTAELAAVNSFLSNAALHLRFVERARVQQTPWSLVQPAEELLKLVAGPGTHFIIRPTWSYNYSIRGDFWGLYRRYLESLKWFSLDIVKKRIGISDSESIYCVSFPRIERANALLHTWWGHEVSHILVARWIMDKFNAEWKAAEPEVKNKFEPGVRASPPPAGELFKERAIKDEIAKLTNATRIVAQQGITELLCDHVGEHLFGPATLASTLEFAARFSLDAPPESSSQNYPPWRYRIRQIVLSCNTDLEDHPEIGYPPPKLKPFVEWLRKAKSMANSKSDEIRIQNKPVTNQAYDFITTHWNDATTNVIGMLPPELSKPYRLFERYANVVSLIDRIEQRLPPNTVGDYPGSPASLQDILCAGWAYKALQIQRDPAWGTYDDFELMSNLVLKGIESSFVHATWGEKIKNAVL